MNRREHSCTGTLARPHSRFSDKLAFLLNNSVRRYLSPPERLLSKLDIGPRDVVLDFGCGPGFYTVAIARMAGKAIGVDVSQRMLEKAREHVQRNRVSVEFLESDGREIRLADASVNLIILGHVFHEIEDRPRVLREFSRILKPLGRLAIIERTQRGKLLAGFGPPIISEAEVVQEVTQAGFTLANTIPHGKDSIIVGRKPGSADD